MRLVTIAYLLPALGLVALSAAAPALAQSPAEHDVAQGLAQTASKPRRIAVIVGANKAPPSRKELRYAYRDARAVHRVLTHLGGFAADDAHVLNDPDPADVLGVLDRELASLRASSGEALLLFYYSGHADAQSLFPNGRPLALSEVKRRLDDARITVRIGIIDACRGGGWTGAKGLDKVAAFDATVPLNFASEGSVLIASSSGLEDAHESEALQGSFFTHHWNAGLRGAGDRNQDGVVTLTEAFDYAKALTVRDTALYTATPQHPSFHLDLRGRRDIALSRLASGDSIIALEQTQGPLQLVHLETGLIVLEVPPGKRHLKLAVPPGRYLVRRRHGMPVRAREILVVAGKTVRVEEGNLAVVGSGALAVKGPPSLRVALDGRPASEILIGFHYAAPTSRTVGDTDDDGGRLTTLAGVMSYLWRTGPYLATNIGLGFAMTEGAGIRNGSYRPAALVSVGEMLSMPLYRLRDWIPLVSNNAIEPYVGARLIAGIEFQHSQQDALPVHVRGDLVAGLRFYVFYAHAGYSRSLWPRSFDISAGAEHAGDTYHTAGGGLSAEIGIRVSRNIF